MLNPIKSALKQPNTPRPSLSKRVTLTVDGETHAALNARAFLRALAARVVESEDAATCDFYRVKERLEENACHHHLAPLVGLCGADHHLAPLVGLGGADDGGRGGAAAGGGTGRASTSASFDSLFGDFDGDGGAVATARAALAPDATNWFFHASGADRGREHIASGARGVDGREGGGDNAAARDASAAAHRAAEAWLRHAGLQAVARAELRHFGRRAAEMRWLRARAREAAATAAARGPAASARSVDAREWC